MKPLAEHFDIPFFFPETHGSSMVQFSVLIDQLSERLNAVDFALLGALEEPHGRYSWDLPHPRLQPFLAGGDGGDV